MPVRRSPNGARHVRPQPGRNRPERVVAINRNAWSQSVGTGGRNHPVRAIPTIAAIISRCNNRGEVPEQTLLAMQPSNSGSLISRALTNGAS